MGAMLVGGLVSCADVDDELSLSEAHLLIKSGVAATREQTGYTWCFIKLVNSQLSKMAVSVYPSILRI
jgi:hypothetical protein